MAAGKREIANHTLSDQFICSMLTQHHLISDEQAENIINNGSALKKNIEKRQQALFKGTPLVNHVSIIDVIASLNLPRADGGPGNVSEEAIFRTLAGIWKFPYKKINPLELDLNLVTSTIPRSFAMKHLIIPIGVQDGSLIVATPNPFNFEILDDISRVTQLKVQAVVSSKTDIIHLINEFFGFQRSIAEAEQSFSGPQVDLGNLEQYVKVTSDNELHGNEKHIINAVNHLFTYAFDQRASDIHIEPKRETSLIRMRIDGILHTVYNLPKRIHYAIVNRIKILSRLDMAEKRRPQDGRIKTDKGDKELEIRVSTVPTAFGEKIVMRIMDPDILFQDLETLGFLPADLIRYNRFIKMPHGIVLVTGPTGSGKSTTLYSTLRELSTPEINITTVEDPIEMISEDFNQIAVQPAVGVTFGSILRNILRQDPDIIMIGEMRDPETAENAVQAALTGHLVLSTLHTNDAPTAVTRMLDLGVPSFLVQSTLIGILAQRLVRKNCIYCKESFTMTPKELKQMGITTDGTGPVTLHRGKGCQQCRGTGYKGRTGIFEVLPYTQDLKAMTKPDTDLEAIRRTGRKQGMISLRENAVQQMLEGTTTYQEVLRVTWDVE